MRIAMMATGGIGGYLAVHLTQRGHEVATIARGAHLEAIRKQGLRLEGDVAPITVRPWMATDDPAAVGPVDVVIFGVKAGALEAAAQASLPLIGPDTLVVPFLNGGEAAERLAQILPPTSVADGVAYVSTKIAGPGRIHQTGAFRRFVFGALHPGQTERLGALRDALHDASVEAPIVEDLAATVWSKLVLMSAMAGVTAGARCTLGDIQTNDELGRLFRDLLAETAAIGRARGLALDADLEAEIWQRAQTLPPHMRASAAIDLAAGLPLEIPWINGAVVRKAGEIGQDAPLNRAIVALLAPYRGGAPGA